MLEVIKLPVAAIAVCPNDGGFHSGVNISYLWFANQMREMPSYRTVSAVVNEFGACNIRSFSWYCKECLDNGMKNPPRKE